MNRKSIIAAAALAAASLSSHAIEGRQVVPERAAAPSAAQWETRDATVPEASPTGALTREEVKAELRELKSAGLYQPYGEASPSPLEDAERTLKLTMLQERDQLAHATPSQQDLIAMADREDEAPAIVIESVPQNEAMPEGPPAQ